MRKMPAISLVIFTLIAPPSAAHSQTREAVAPPAASLQHSIMKGVTYKTGTIITNMLFLRPATGSWIDASILTAAFTGVAIFIYVSNDYLWDNFLPSKPIVKDEKFDVSESAKRVTLKMITYKTAVTMATSGMLYLWTNSLPIVLTVGAGLALAKVGVFYVNDLAWEWYDWNKANTPSK
ncbi:MAG: hypothetical protein WCJ64_10600 [Rhodospirillaceae bacterium]